MLYAWSKWDEETGFDGMLQSARRALSLFQHHDGITGTARDHVVKDYAKQMLDALSATKFVIQQAAYKYLTKPSVSVSISRFFQIINSNFRNLIPRISDLPTRLQIYLFQHRRLPNNWFTKRQSAHDYPRRWFTHQIYSITQLTPERAWGNSWILCIKTVYQSRRLGW